MAPTYVVGDQVHAVLGVFVLCMTRYLQTNTTIVLKGFYEDFNR